MPCRSCEAEVTLKVGSCSHRGVSFSPLHEPAGLDSASHGTPSSRLVESPAAQPAATGGSRVTAPAAYSTSGRILRLVPDAVGDGVLMGLSGVHRASRRSSEDIGSSFAPAVRDGRAPIAAGLECGVLLDDGETVRYRGVVSSFVPGAGHLIVTSSRLILGGAADCSLQIVPLDRVESVRGRRRSRGRRGQHLRRDHR